MKAPTIRFIVRSTNIADAAHVGGPVATTYKTFDLECPELAAYLTENIGSWEKRELIAAEILPQTEDGGA